MPATRSSIFLSHRVRGLSYDRPSRLTGGRWFGERTDSRELRPATTMDSATEGVLSVARSVLEQLDLEVVLARVLEAARDLTGARYAALGVLDDSRHQLARFLTLGIDDVGSHPYSYGFPVGHPPMSSFLGVPIVVGDEPYGNLYLTEKHDAAEFSEAAERSLMLLADFAGLAIDHAQRYSGSES
jgi:GAF domain-containing protein